MELNGDVTMTSPFLLTQPIKSTSSNDPVHQVWDRSPDWCVHQNRYHSGKIELNGDVTITSLFLLTSPIEYTSSSDSVHQV